MRNPSHAGTGLAYTLCRNRQLLQQVVDAEIGANNQRLANTMAKQRAEKLLIEADDYYCSSDEYVSYCNRNRK